MTKETKIGLIVGLAFIILFAIILSEKGAQNTPKAPSALTLADAGTEKAHATGDPEEPLSDAGRLPIRSEPAGGGIQGTALRSDRGKNERPVGRPIPGEDEPIMPLPESVVNRLNLQMEETEVALDDPANPTPVSPAPSDAPMSVSDAVASALTASPHEAHPSRTENGATRSRASATHNPGGVAPAESTVFDRPSPAETMKIIARHRVMPGESLGKIAARYYGRATPSRINALFDANRDTLASIHTIRADTLLKIPQLDPAEQIGFEPVRTFAPADILARGPQARDQDVRIPMPVDESAEKRIQPGKKKNRLIADAGDATPLEKESQSFTWYRVRERDTLSRIARRELGNERLFLTIFDMNRDIIQNLNKIKPGMKIRLPKRMSALPATTMSLTARAPGAEVP